MALSLLTPLPPPCRFSLRGVGPRAATGAAGRWAQHPAWTRGGGLRLHRRVPSKQERLNVAGHQRVERKRPGRWGEVGAAPVPLGNSPGAARTSCEPRLRGFTSRSLFSSLVGEGAQAESRT